MLCSSDKFILMLNMIYLQNSSVLTLSRQYDIDGKTTSKNDEIGTYRPVLTINFINLFQLNKQGSKIHTFIINYIRTYRSLNENTWT